MDRTGLYDDDFYAWTQEQAGLLRQLPTISNRLDVALIAEEIEDLGRSEVRSAQSLCEHIIEHLLKLEYSGLDEPANHWRREIIEWRLQLDKTLTQSIRPKIDLPERYRAVRRLLSGEQQSVTASTLAALPSACPYTVDQIVSAGEEDWFPDRL
ncbi:MAG: DUF29 domain-containing protein [Alphaproteobacteria bacterium]|nr:DUF29 domain-containing protein [Alphaproteobacteria bacterium]